jgi:hypothetical protein
MIFDVIREQPFNFKGEGYVVVVVFVVVFFDIKIKKLDFFFCVCQKLFSGFWVGWGTQLSLNVLKR